MTKQYLIILLFFLSMHVFGQSQFALTIDDVPNTKLFEQNHFQANLLNTLDSLQIPVSIFINEGLIYKTTSVSKNFELLNQWIQRDYTLLGNHTFAHSRYSEVGFESFTQDISKGLSISSELAKMYKKPLNYFRFTYNDLGKDSLQKHKIENYLNEKQYILTPFTIESSDWIFNHLYEYYLKNDNRVEAERIAESYINLSLAYFHYFDSLSVDQYGRHIKQIYLCHDNAINADYLSVLLEKLTEKGYSIISLEEAMQDEVYQQANQYTKKWGVSWFYRWMTDSKNIRQLMIKEPDITDIYEEYQEYSK